MTTTTAERVPAPFADHISRTCAMHDTFHAWRLRDTPTPVVIDIYATTIEDAVIEAQNSCGHGDTLFIRQTHARTENQTLRAWRVRQGKREFRRVGADPVPRWVQPLKLDPLFTMAVDSFAPVARYSAFAPLDALRGGGNV